MSRVRKIAYSCSCLLSLLLLPSLKASAQYPLHEGDPERVISEQLPSLSREYSDGCYSTFGRLGDSIGCAFLRMAWGDTSYYGWSFGTFSRTDDRISVPVPYNASYYDGYFDWITFFKYPNSDFGLRKIGLDGGLVGFWMLDPDADFSVEVEDVVFQPVNADYQPELIVYPSDVADEFVFATYDFQETGVYDLSVNYFPRPDYPDLEPGKIRGIVMLTTAAPTDEDQASRTCQPSKTLHTLHDETLDRADPDAYAGIYAGGERFICAGDSIHLVLGNGGDGDANDATLLSFDFWPSDDF